MNSTYYIKRAGLLLAAAGFATGATALVEVGPGVITLSVDAGVKHDSNIFADNTEESDLSFTGTGALAYVQSRGLMSLNAQAGVNYTTFASNSDQDSTDPFASISLSGVLQQGGKTNYGFVGRYSRTKDTNVELANRVRSETFALTGRTDWAFSPKLGVRFSAAYSELNYKNVGLNDNDTTTLGVSALWYYSEKLTLLAGYRYRDINFSIRTRDIQSDTFLVGAEGELTPKVTGTVNAGISSFNDGRSDSLFYEVGLDWAATRRGVVSLTGARDNSGSVTGDNNVDTSLTLTFRQQVSSHATVSAGVTMGTYKRDGNAPRDDDFWRINIGSNLRIGDHGRLGASFSYEDRNSNSAVSDYTRVIFAITGGYTF